MRLEQQRAAIAADQALRLGILGGLDEFDAPLAHPLELLRLEARPLQRIREQLQQQRAIARQEMAVQQQGLAVAAGFETAAGPLDGLRKLERIALARAAREHLGGDAGNARTLRWIQSRAAANH